MVTKIGSRLINPHHHSYSAQKEKLKDLSTANDPWIGSTKVPLKKIKTKLNIDLKNLNKINIYDGGEKIVPGQ